MIFCNHSNPADFSSVLLHTSAPSDSSCSYCWSGSVVRNVGGGATHRNCAQRRQFWCIDEAREMLNHFVDTRVYDLGASEYITTVHPTAPLVSGSNCSTCAGVCLLPRVCSTS
jgi:hypothetical protein